jgi:hypothetical protein
MRVFSPGVLAPDQIPADSGANDIGQIGELGVEEIARHNQVNETKGREFRTSEESGHVRSLLARSGQEEQTHSRRYGLMHTI